MTTPAIPTTTPAPVAPATPTTPTVQPTPNPAAAMTAARAKLLGAADGKTGWEGVTFPNPAAGMAATDGEPDASDATPTAPAAITDAAPADPSVDAAADAAADGPEFVQDAEGKWHRADGTFATADEIAQITAQLAAEPAAPDTPAAPDASAEPNPEHIVSIRRRDGTTREIVIEDQELRDEIRTNLNDGMRGRQFREATAALEAKLERINRLDTLIQTNPEAVVRESLTPEQRVNLATMLLAEHFDDLVPIIQSFDQTPATRMQAVAQAQLRIRQQQDTFTAQVAVQQQIAEAKQAVAALIPDTASEADADGFWVDASRDLTDAIARGERVDASAIPTLLAPRLARYGFSASPASAPARPRITLASSSTAPTPAAPIAQGLASPANAAAQSMAQAVADAKTAQTRLRLRQQQRTHAAAVPPQGAGAAPVRMPAFAPGTTIEERSKQLRQMGGWGVPHR